MTTAQDATRTYALDTALMNETASDINRKVTTSYTLPSGYRVKVTTTHHKSGKNYRLTISDCMTETDNGFTWEKHRMGRDLMRSLGIIPTPRYNFGRLCELHGVALLQALPLIQELLEVNV